MKQFSIIRQLVACGVCGIGLASTSGAQQNPSFDPLTPATQEAAAANAQAGFYFNGLNQSPWFADQGVRQQLQMSDNQYQALNQGYGQAWTTYNQGISGLDSNLPDVQRMQRQQALYGNFQTDLSKATNGVFTDPTVNQRYNQLYLQYRGYGAFNDPTIQQELSLTPAQRQRFQQYDRDWNRNMNTWYRDYQTDAEAVQRRFNQSQAEYARTLNSTLTPDQQKTWSQMTGEPYKWTPDTYYQNAPVPGTSKKIYPLSK